MCRLVQTIPGTRVEASYAIHTCLYLDHLWPGLQEQGEKCNKEKSKKHKSKEKIKYPNPQLNLNSSMYSGTQLLYKTRNQNKGINNLQYMYMFTISIYVFRINENIKKKQ